METNVVDAIGTIGFGGVGIAVIAWIAYLYGKELLKNHKETTERVCDSFDRALDRRDKDIQYLVNEIRNGKSGGSNNNG